MKTGTYKTAAAETAQAIRATLKANYPAIGFTVHAKNFAGGNSVDVSWTDGPTTGTINRLIAEYEGGTFDPSCDLYEYRKDSPKHPTAKYVFANRHFSKEAYATHRAVVCAKYDIPTDTNDDMDVIQIGGHAYLGQLVTHELHQMDLTLDDTTRNIEETQRQDKDADDREIAHAAAMREAEEISEDDLTAAATFMDKLDHTQEQ